MATDGSDQELKYDPSLLEPKWQEFWKKEKTFEVKTQPSKKKYYLLDMFPYPSGRLHMGHVRNYTIGDVIGRYRMSQGYNVLHPMGWDAFGLPAENAAIKNQVHPERWTRENIENMRQQLKRLGLGYDWSREIATCFPEYYRWEQLFFIEMYERGLAYKKHSTVNWCPTCQTVLANEQVEEGRCWRCESETTTRELEQWFLKTTQYAQELLDDLDTLKGWPERILTMQRNWIGRSLGAEIEFELEENPKKKLTIFTTRPDTLFGVSFMAIAPEHPLAEELYKGKSQAAQVQDFVQKSRKQSKIVRTSEDTPKEGVFTGSYALHPLTGKKIPVYVANFVVMDYGTGALMAVPGHDIRDHAFATKYNLPIIQVIESADPKTPPIQEAAYTGPGKMVQSGNYNGLPSTQGIEKIIEDLEKKKKGKKSIQYRLRDWGLSRQRYWGTPIPMIYCDKCGTVPVPKNQLPVTLPPDIQFTGEGGSPLSQHPDFMKTTCPKCRSTTARRETDTMDTFVESSWYYLRYLSPQEEEAPFRKEDLRYWLGIDQYIGGVEHATMHLLYFRFFHKVLRDLGHLPKDLPAQDLKEPCHHLLNQGIVYKDGAKMSKSKGNVVEPDLIIGKYGADTVRVFSMFAAPVEKVLEYSDQGVEGAFRFLGRIWRLIHKHESLLRTVIPFHGKHSELTLEASRKLRAKTHQTIVKVKRDFDHGFHFNTAIAAIMELVNEAYLFNLSLGVDESLAILRETFEAILRLLNPFAPHMTEELWEFMGNHDRLVGKPFPEADPEALTKEIINYAVQVNGKLRTNLEVSPSLDQEKVVALAQEESKVAKHLEGKSIVRTVFVAGKLINFVVK